MNTVPDKAADDQFFIHGDPCGSGYFCWHCRMRGLPTFQFFRHGPSVHKHLIAYGESLQFARVFGVSPSPSNIITTRFFRGAVPEPHVVFAYAQQALRGEWP